MSLQPYQEKHQTKAFKKYHAFFAFSNDQFSKAMNPNFKYRSLGAGLYAPIEFASKLIDELETIHKKAIADHQKEKSKKDIIWYELSNYETQISGDLDNVFCALSDYEGITKEDIIKEYKEYYHYCVCNDYF